MKKTVSRLKKLSLVQKFLLGFGVLIVLGVIANSGSYTSNLNAKNLNKTFSSSQSQASKNASQQHAVVTKQETELQSIPFTTTDENDSSLLKGQTEIKQVGLNGTNTLTYNVTYTNGQQTNKKLVSTVQSGTPVTQIVEVGTYVAPAPAPTTSCTNGTYVNSAGNTICSPEKAPSKPAGATAQCSDGTYSFSQSRSGTCSHHGGVASWF